MNIMNKEKVHRILHIDDDDANRYAVKIILERAGYEVIAAVNGREGLKLALSKPDLIILDIRLPDLSGFEVCRLIKQDRELQSIPVLQTSATFVSNEHKVEGLDSGADGYLAQPIESAVLVATVRSLLRIKEAERKAYEAIRSREETLAIVSHDLRNPLASIMLQVSLLGKYASQGDNRKVLEKLDSLTQACNRMNRLIGDLLDVSSIEGGKFKVNKQDVRMGHLLQEVAHSFEEMARVQDIDLKLHLPEKDFKANIDSDRLTQLLVNLISNSMKFTPPNGTIALSLEEVGDKFKLVVSDTGSGIKAESLSHIFDRFWQGHKEKNAGVGLGLSIVKGIVDAHQGQIMAESELGKGTAFTLVIPKN